MKNDRWGVFVCSCEGLLAPHRERLQSAAPVCRVARHPKDDAADFAREARADGVTRVLIACCQGPEAFEDAFREERFSPMLHDLDLKQFCYLPHEDPAQADRKALRMIRGAMRAAERAREVPENYLEVGTSILVATDSEEGLRIARRLAPLGRVTVVMAGPPEKGGKAPAKSVNRGHLAGLEGSLGRFTAHIDPGGGNGSSTGETRPLRADQIVAYFRNDAPALKSRTGIHLLASVEVPALDALAEEVAGLSGSFMKPEHIAYDEGICAGGAAETQTCGRCIEHCPYAAIARAGENPLRIKVDHLSCEGCGACSAACPTGALEFLDPTPDQLYGRLGGMLGARRAAAEGGAEAEPPPVVVFHCPEEGRNVLTHAAEHGLQYGAGILPVEVPCLRHVSAAGMMAPFRLGAAGVGLLGCEDCGHGERTLLLQEMDLTGRILDAFGMDAGRLRMFTADADTQADTVPALERFAAGIAPSPIRFEGRGYRGGGNRQVIADTLETFIDQLGREPGGLPVKSHEPFAFPDVSEERCTLCRSCANVCPTHAFRFDAERQSLSLKPVDCVACGLCESACPEDAIVLRREFYLERGALESQVVVEDETIHCGECGKPFINRKALETIESRVLGLESLAGTFSGAREGLLRLCPDCRAVAAIREVERGWEP